MSITLATNKAASSPVSVQSVRIDAPLASRTNLRIGWAEAVNEKFITAVDLHLAGVR